MRECKTRLEMFSIHDHVGLAAHMEKQAKKGWLLEKIGNWGWRYRRIEPQSLRFSVTYFPPASVFDPHPTEGEETFREYCERAGWKLAASNAQIQVFYTDDPNTVPLETDAVMQVENIHAAAKKTTLLSNWMLGVMGLIYTIMWLVSFFENPVSMAADYNGWFRALSFGNLLLLCSVELISYYLWHRKAVRVAEESGHLHPTRSHRAFQSVSLVVVIVSLLFWFLSMQSKRTKVIAAMALLNMTILMVVVQGCRIILKKLGVSKTKNKVITLTVDFVLAFLLIGMLPNWIMRMDLSDKTPVDTYEHRGSVRYVYNDPLPLSVEELVDVDPSLYSKSMDVQKTVLASLYDASQRMRWDSEEMQPDLSYRMAVSAVPSWTEFFWNGWVSDYPRHGDRLVAVDSSPWGAVETYRVYTGSDEGGAHTNVWYIRWEDRFVRLSADWELTEEQMGIIAEKLLHCAE